MERLRPYRDADAAPLHALFRQATRYGAEGYYTTEELDDWAGPPEVPDGWAARHADNITIIAEEDGQITGYMMMHPDGYLDMAFVRPDRRRTGTAALLYDGMVDRARDLALPRMTVLASRLMERFLLKRGWRLAPELAKELGEIPLNRTMLLDIAP